MTPRNIGINTSAAAGSGPDARPLSRLTKLWNGLLSFLDELPHWIPGLLPSVLYWETEPLRIAPFLWNSQWKDSVQSLNHFAVGLSASAWMVLVTLKRDGVIKGGGRTIRKYFIAAVILAIPCFVFHAIFLRWTNPPALWHGFLEAWWQLSYVAMIVAACIALSFYLIYTIDVATTVLRVSQVPQKPGMADLETSPQSAAPAVSSARESKEGHVIADLRSEVGQLERALQGVHERLNQVLQRLGPIEAHLTAAGPTAHASTEPPARPQGAPQAASGAPATGTSSETS